MNIIETMKLSFLIYCLMQYNYYNLLPINCRTIIILIIFSKTPVCWNTKWNIHLFSCTSNFSCPVISKQLFVTSMQVGVSKSRLNALPGLHIQLGRMYTINVMAKSLHELTLKLRYHKQTCTSTWLLCYSMSRLLMQNACAMQIKWTPNKFYIKAGSSRHNP